MGQNHTAHYLISGSHVNGALCKHPLAISTKVSTGTATLIQDYSFLFALVYAYTYAYAYGVASGLSLVTVPFPMHHDCQFLPSSWT